MKKVIIIEDDFNEFKNIKGILDSSFACPQQYTNDDFDTDIKDNFINKLKNSLLVTFVTKEEYANQEKMIQDLLAELKGYCNEKDDEPVYIIDVVLDKEGEGNYIDGVRFKNKFIKEMYPDKDIPVLFITRETGNPRLNAEDCVNEINDETICKCQTKPDTDDWHRVQEDIKNFIKNARSRPRLEGNEKTKKDIVDIYEGN